MAVDLSRRELMWAGAALSALTVGCKAVSDTTGSQRENEPGPYDLVITGGRVIDPETGLDAVRNVGIKEDRIAAISEEELTGAKTLAADGLVVAPGFIDLHAHGQQLPAAWMQAFDGVTTQLELESGLLPVGMAYDKIAAEGRPINFGLGAAWTFARVTALTPEAGEPDGTITWFGKAFTMQGWQEALPTPEQLEHIIDRVETGLKEGALGISVNAGYAPGMGRKEYYRLAELAAKYNVSTFTHDRYTSVIEPMSAFEALGEQISLAATTGAQMHICHINSTANRDLKDCTDLIKEAQAKGLPVTTEAYTYGAFSTAIGAAMLTGPDWLARFGTTDYGAMEYRGTPMTKDQIEAMQAAEPGNLIVFRYLDEDKPEEMELLDLAVLFPGGAIASDGLPWSDSSGKYIEGNVWPLPDDAFAHPRSAGTFSRFFANWVRERGAISLSDAIAKCTLIPTQILAESVPQILKKGRIQVGCDADIVVFDPSTIQDRATFVEPAQTSVGFRHVVVNGTPIIEDASRNGDALPGRPVRRPT